MGDYPVGETMAFVMASKVAHPGRPEGHPQQPITLYFCNCGDEAELLVQAMHHTAEQRS